MQATIAVQNGATHFLVIRKRRGRFQRLLAIFAFEFSMRNHVSVDVLPRHLDVAHLALHLVGPVIFVGMRFDTFSRFELLRTLRAAEGPLRGVDATMFLQMTFQSEYFVAKRALEAGLIAVPLGMGSESGFSFESHATLLAFKRPHVRVRRDVLHVTASQLEGFPADFAGLIVNFVMSLHLFLTGESPIATWIRAFEAVQLRLALRSFVPLHASLAFKDLVTMLALVGRVRVRVQVFLQMLRFEEAFAADPANVFADLLLLHLEVVGVILLFGSIIYGSFLLGR